jgi:hypothetical protein
METIHHHFCLYGNSIQSNNVLYYMASIQMAASLHTPDFIPVIQYCYTESRHFTLEAPTSSGNYSRLYIRAPSTTPMITLTPGAVHYIKTGIRISHMAPGYRFRIENTPAMKEAPFYILEYSNYSQDDLYLKLVSTRNIDLDPGRIVGQLVVEANPIILYQSVPVTHSAPSIVVPTGTTLPSSMGGRVFSDSSDSD